jgi:hypothetical protein
MVNVRITHTRRCAEGFYLLVNGQRLRFATRRLAMEAIPGILLLQRIQVVSVREYRDRARHNHRRPYEHTDTTATATGKTKSDLERADEAAAFHRVTIPLPA